MKIMLIVAGSVSGNLVIIVFLARISVSRAGVCMWGSV